MICRQIYTKMLLFIILLLWFCQIDVNPLKIGIFEQTVQRIFFPDVVLCSLSMTISAPASKHCLLNMSCGDFIRKPHSSRHILRPDVGTKPEGAVVGHFDALIVRVVISP